MSVSSHRSADSSDVHRGVPDPVDATRPFYKKDAFFTGSKVELHRISRTSLNSNPYMATAVKVDEKTKKSTGKAFADILSAMTDFSILRNKKMLLICLGNIFSMLGYYLPIMCLVSFAVEDLQINRKKAPFLMTIFGLTTKFFDECFRRFVFLQVFVIQLVVLQVDRSACFPVSIRYEFTMLRCI